MAFEAEFLTMMPHTVTVEPFLGVDRFNAPSYGPAAIFRARIVGKVISLRRSEKEDASGIFDVYLDAGASVFTVDDRLTLPADAAWVDATPIIFAVARATDESGHHHVKLQCGFMYHRQGQ